MKSCRCITAGWAGPCVSISAHIRKSAELLLLLAEHVGWADITDVLALIHTFPFIVVDFQSGMMDMYMKTDWYTVSGIITLVPQTLLVSLSIAPIRNRAYELFKGCVFRCFLRLSDRQTP